jgi:hypothetical protein
MVIYIQFASKLVQFIRERVQSFGIRKTVVVQVIRKRIEKAV